MSLKFSIYAYFLCSVLIGLTLAVDERFKVLFIVIVFHRKYCVHSLEPYLIE